MPKKNIAAALIIAAFVGGGSFYGGMQYSQSKTSSRAGGTAFANMTPEQRQARLQQAGGNVGTRRTGGRMQGQFLTGDILTKDDKSITIKLTDGGSKIIYFSASTTIGVTTDGSTTDLITNQHVTVTGNANSDGSVTAQAIHIRPLDATTK